MQVKITLNSCATTLGPTTLSMLKWMPSLLSSLLLLHPKHYLLLDRQGRPHSSNYASCGARWGQPDVGFTIQWLFGILNGMSWTHDEWKREFVLADVHNLAHNDSIVTRETTPKVSTDTRDLMQDFRGLDAFLSFVDYG